jgi:hypothetical protein
VLYSKVAIATPGDGLCPRRRSEGGAVGRCRAQCLAIGIVRGASCSGTVGASLTNALTQNVAVDPRKGFWRNEGGS